MTRPQRSWGRFGVSVSALVVVVAGIPAFLIACSRLSLGAPHPVPGVGSADEIRTWVERQLSTSEMVPILLRTLLIVGWVLWALLLGSVIAAVITSRPRFSHLSLPSLPVFDGFAGWIAAGLVAVSSFAPTLHAVAAPVPSPVVPHSVHSAVMVEASDSRAGELGEVPDGYVEVQTGESIQRVAHRALGDAERWPELWELRDAQRAGGTGASWTQPWRIEAGWLLRVPTQTSPSSAVATAGVALPPERGATTEPVENSDSKPTTYVVEPGDTLWDIAGDELGDPTAWPAIWDENQGADMGGGRTFDDPNLILPGWELDVDAKVDAAVAEPAVDAPGVVEPIVDLPTMPEPVEAAPTVEVAEVTDPGGTTEAPDAVAGLDVPPTVPPPPIAPLPSASTAPTPTLAPNDGTADISTVTPNTAPIGASSTSTSTTTVVPVDPGQASPGPSRSVAPDAPTPIRMEHAAMLAAGILALVGVRRRQRLRSAMPRSRVPEPRPEIVETERLLRGADPGERSAHVDVACRSAAFALIDTDVQIVAVQVSQEGDVALTLSGRPPAPAPPPWTTERDGTVWRLAGGMPIELLTESARRVGMPCVAMVQLGIDDDGNDVLVDLEACGTLAIDAQPNQADSVVRAIAAGLASSLYAEVAHLITVSLPVEALLGHRNAHQAESVDAAFDLAASLVGTTSTNERSSFELRSLRTGGEMWEPAVILLREADRHGGSSGIVQRPAPGHGVALVTVVEPSGASDAAARLIAGADGWTLTVAGATLSLTPIGLDRADIDAVVDVLADAERPLIPMDEVEPPLVWLDDPTPSTRTSHGDVDPDAERLPGDVLVTFEPMAHAVVVKLLGGVEVIDRDGTVGQFERSKTVELIAWLATHRTHSTRTAARTALWELDVRDATFANVVSEARRALGRLVPPPAGEEWVARTLTEQLPLHPWVVTDAQLIEQRLEQARLQPPAQAIGTLRPTVEMVTGMPFAGTSYLWPDAEGITSNLVLLAISAATELAAHGLSVGDTDLVFWATGQGLTVLPGYEELIALRMRAHARSGDHAGVRHEWESYERVIIADPWSDGEPAPKLLALRRELLTSSGE